MVQNVLNIFGFQKTQISTGGFSIERASLRDVSEIHEIINYFAGLGEMLHRTESEINQSINDFVIVKGSDADLIDMAALHKLDDKLAG